MVLSGGSQLKVLARDHARAVVDVADRRPDLVRFWRRSWIPDETFVASVLSSPALVPDWAAENVPAHLWWIGWDGSRRKSPPWLGVEHLSYMQEKRAVTDGIAPIFARKFTSSRDTAVLDVIDAQRRALSGLHPGV